MSEGLDYGALADFTPDKAIPSDWYRAELKVNPTKSGDTVVGKIIEYFGKKEGGIEAIGKEVSVFIGNITENTPDFAKQRNFALAYELCLASDVLPERDLDKRIFNGKIVDIAVGDGKDQFGITRSEIKHFRHA